MVGVNDAGGVQRVSPFLIKLKEKLQIFVMVVWKALAVLIYRAPKDRMGKGVARGFYLPAAEDKFMAVLCGVDGDRKSVV